MDTHNNARLTPKGREAMVRAVVDGGLSKAAAARKFNTAPKTVAKPVERFREWAPAAALYGATSAPASEVQLEALFHSMRGHLERSHIVFEFLAIMRSAPILPLLLRPAQHLLVRAPLI